MPPAPLYRVVLKVYEPAPPTFFSFTLGTTVANQELVLPSIDVFLVENRANPDGKKKVEVKSVYDINGIHISAAADEVPFVVPYAHEPLPVGMGSWYFAPATLMIAPADTTPDEGEFVWLGSEWQGVSFPVKLYLKLPPGGAP